MLFIIFASVFVQKVQASHAVNRAKSYHHEKQTFLSSHQSVGVKGNQ